MWIVLGIIGVFILVSAIAGVICYYKLAVPAMKPIAAENRALCEQIVKAGNGYPWVCRRALKTGLCPCQPCSKVEGIKTSLQ